MNYNLDFYLLLIETFTDCFIFAHLFLIFILEIFFNLPIPAAARSLATPLTPKQSGRLGVIDRSITFSVFDF